MGALFSSPFIDDPAQYAVRVGDGLDSSSIPSYDYVIIGGGEDLPLLSFICVFSNDSLLDCD